MYTHTRGTHNFDLPCVFHITYTYIHTYTHTHTYILAAHTISIHLVCFILCIRMYKYIHTHVHTYSRHTQLSIYLVCDSSSIRMYSSDILIIYASQLVKNFKSQSFTTIVCVGWLRLVGSLKLYASFAEYHIFYRALLQKRPII